MNPINKRVALCNQLNMNFEEANELFDNESLESMQMARVNGGIAFLTIAAGVAFIAGLVTIAVGSKEIYSWFIKDDGSTPEAQLEADLRAWAIKNNCSVSTIKGDSLVTPEGIKIYNFSATIIAPTADK